MRFELLFATFLGVSKPTSHESQNKNHHIDNSIHVIKRTILYLIVKIRGNLEKFIESLMLASFPVHKKRMYFQISVQKTLGYDYTHSNIDSLSGTSDGFAIHLKPSWTSAPMFAHGCTVWQK